MSKKKHYEVIEQDGTECPRCSALAETREHTSITPKLLKQPYYYQRWYNCKNQDCKTTTFMLEGWKVMNNNSVARDFKMLEEDRENLERISLFQ